MCHHKSTGRNTFLELCDQVYFRTLAIPKTMQCISKKWFQNSIVKRSAATINGYHVKRLSFENLWLENTLSKHWTPLFRMSGGPFSSHHLQDTQGSRLISLSFHKMKCYRACRDMILEPHGQWEPWKTKHHPKTALSQHWVRLTSCEVISLFHISCMTIWHD